MKQKKNLNEHNSISSRLSLQLAENEKMLKAAEKQLRNAPQGCVCCDHRENGWYYRHREWENGKQNDCYIPDSERRFAVSLGMKPFNTIVKRLAVNNIKAIKYFLKHYTADVKSTALDSMSEGIRELISPVLDSKAKWMKEWMQSPYDKNSFRTEECTIKTLSGFFVRSKGEQKIADDLFIRGIAFRYDAAVIINGKKIYADFVILHPDSTPENMIFIIWEHAGRMEEKMNYQPGAIDRIVTYFDNEMVIGENILYTFETRWIKLSSETVASNIEAMLRMTDGSPIRQAGGHYVVKGSNQNNCGQTDRNHYLSRDFN